MTWESESQARGQPARSRSVAAATAATRDDPALDGLARFRRIRHRVGFVSATRRLGGCPRRVPRRALRSGAVRVMAVMMAGVVVVVVRGGFGWRGGVGRLRRLRSAMRVVGLRGISGLVRPLGVRGRARKECRGGTGQRRCARLGEREEEGEAGAGSRHGDPDATRRGRGRPAPYSEGFASFPAPWIDPFPFPSRPRAPGETDRGALDETAPGQGCDGGAGSSGRRSSPGWPGPSPPTASRLRCSLSSLRAMGATRSRSRRRASGPPASTSRRGCLIIARLSPSRSSPPRRRASCCAGGSTAATSRTGRQRPSRVRRPGRVGHQRPDPRRAARRTAACSRVLHADADDNFVVPAKPTFGVARVPATTCGSAPSTSLGGFDHLLFVFGLLLLANR